MMRNFLKILKNYFLCKTPRTIEWIDASQILLSRRSHSLIRLSSKQILAALGWLIVHSYIYIWLFITSKLTIYVNKMSFCPLLWSKLDSRPYLVMLRGLIIIDRTSLVESLFFIRRVWSSVRIRDLFSLWIVSMMYDASIESTYFSCCWDGPCNYSR